MSAIPKRYTIAEARANLSDILNKASYGKERIELKRRNKTVAYIVPVEDVRLLEKIENMLDIRDAESRKDEATISLDELRRDLDI